MGAVARDFPVFQHAGQRYGKRLASGYGSEKARLLPPAFVIRGKGVGSKQDAFGILLQPVANQRG